MPKDFPNLMVIEKNILKSRQTGLSFCQIGENDIRVTTDKIIIETSSMTGGAMPNTDGYAKIISDQLVRFIMDFGYEELTVDEIILAVRINISDQKIPDGVEVQYVPYYGNCFNISYIAKVLANYKIIRDFLDKKIQYHIDGYMKNSFQ